MSSMVSSFLVFDSTIQDLCQQLSNEEHRFSSKFNEQDNHQGLFLRSVRQLFKSNTRLIGCNSLHSSLFSDISKIDVDSRFLKTFVGSISRWSDAARMMKNLGSLDAKIDAVISELSEKLSTAVKKKYMSRRPQEVLDLVRSCQEKIDLLKSDCGEALQHLSGCSFNVHSFLSDYSNWRKFVESIRKNLIDLKSKFCDDNSLGEEIDSFEAYLFLLQDFLSCAQQHYVFGPRGDQVIADFVTHAAYVFVHAALDSCYCWFKKMDPFMAESKIKVILSRKSEIDPTNPEFLDSSLKFLVSLNKPHPDPTKDQLNFVPSFVRYLLKQDTRSLLHEELMFLVYYVTRKQEESNEDAQSLVAEIKAMLLGVGFLYQSLPVQNYLTSESRYGIPDQKPDHLLCSEFLTKILLLRVEIILKEGQSGRRFYVIFTDKSRVDELNMILNQLRMLYRRISQEKEQNGEETLTLIEEVAKEVLQLDELLHGKEVAKCRNGFLLVLMRTVLFKAKSFLMELIRGDSIPPVFPKDQLEILLDGLEFYTEMITSKQLEITENVELELKDMDAVSRGISSMSYLLLTNKISKEMINRTILSLCGLVDKMKLINTEHTCL